MSGLSKKREKTRKKSLDEKMKNRIYLEKLEVDRSITLNGSVSYRVCGCYKSGSKQIPVLDACEHVDGHLGFKKGEIFLARRKTTFFAFCALFYDPLDVSDYIASTGSILVNNEFGTKR